MILMERLIGTQKHRGSGNDQVLTNAQFNENVKPLGNTRVKYAHILHRPAAVV